MWKGLNTRIFHGYDLVARSPLPRLAEGVGGGGAPTPVLHDCIGSNFPVKFLGQGSYRPSYAAPVVRNWYRN